MPKILIIEDDPDIAAIERDYLELSGYEAVICADGTAGLNAALTESYDLLLLDLMLGSAYAIVNGPTSLSTPLPPMNLISFRWPAFLLGIVLLLALELLKQAWDRLAALRPAKLTAPTGFQVFADGAHRHKVPVFAVQQTLVVCLLEQPTGIRQLLLLLGNQLVIIFRKPEGLLIGVLLVLNVDGILRQRLLIFFFAVIIILLRIYRYPQKTRNAKMAKAIKAAPKPAPKSEVLINLKTPTPMAMGPPIKTVINMKNSVSIVSRSGGFGSGTTYFRVSVFSRPFFTTLSSFSSAYAACSSEIIFCRYGSISFCISNSPFV